MKIAILAFEDEPQFTKVSFRFKAVADLNQLAARLRGGGHARAAGAPISIALTGAREKLVRKARELASRLSPGR